jgi:SpoVK/Ycf46/Vps4 family AAA+-type ATPase
VSTTSHEPRIPTRADPAVVVGLPDVRGRIEILKHHMGEVSYDVDVDPSIIARGCPGMSGADLQNLVNQAAVKAAREGSKVVGLKHFEWAKGERGVGFVAHDRPHPHGRGETVALCHRGVEACHGVSRRRARSRRAAHAGSDATAQSVSGVADDTDAQHDHAPWSSSRNHFPASGTGQG